MIGRARTAKEGVSDKALGMLGRRQTLLLGARLGERVAVATRAQHRGRHRLREERGGWDTCSSARASTRP